MAIVIVERSFDEPQVFDELQAIEDGKAWCLEMHGVTFLRTYFSMDHRRMVCLYDAPDAAAVRHSQDRAGLPYTRIWAPETLDGPGEEPIDDRGQVLVVERTFPQPVGIAQIEEMANSSGWCLDMYRVSRVASHVSKDGLSGLCVFLAPDAEAVRKANTTTGIPFERVWAAQVKRKA